MGWGDLPTSLTKKKRKRGRKTSVPPMGPYRAESGNKKVRSKATSAEKRELGKQHTRTGRRVRRLEQKDKREAAAAKKDAAAATKAVTKAKASKPIETLRRAEEKAARTTDRKLKAQLRESSKRLRHALASEAAFKAGRKTPEGSPVKANFPDKALKEVAPRAYRKAFRSASAGGHGSSRGLGEPEDLTTAITLAAPGGGVVGALGKRAAEAGAKTVVKEVGEAAAAKVESTGSKAVARVLNAGSGVRAGGRLAGRAAMRAAGRDTTKAAERAAESAASRTVRRAGAKAAAERSRAASAAVPGIKAGKVGALGLPVVRGHVEAVVDNPKKTAKTTARALPGLVTYPVGVAIKGGITAGRAASTVAHEAGVPGAAGYSGKEILAPVAHIPKEQLDFARQVAKLATSSDAKEVQREVEDNLGLTLPIMLGLGSKAAGDKIGKGRIVEAVRKITEKSRERHGKAHGYREGKAPRVLERTGQRKEAAKIAARGRTRVRGELSDRQQGMLEAARGATDGEVVRKGVLRGRRGKKLDLKIRDADVASFLQRHPMKLDDPVAMLAEVKRIKARLKPIPEGHEPAPSQLMTRDVIAYIEKRPDVLANPNVIRVVREYRKQGAHARQTPGLAPEHSERARFLSAASTRDIPFPEERYPRSVRDVVRSQPKRGELAKDVLRREAREDRASAKAIKRQSKALVKQAERRAEGARRRALRAKVSEASAAGEARVKVSQRDRELLRKEPDYVKAVKANNRAQKTLREAKMRYRNATATPEGLYRNGELSAQAKVVVNGLRAAEARAKASRADLDRVKAAVLERAGKETSKAGRGQKATALAGLGRGPAGTLAKLERRGGKVLEAERHQAELEGQVVTARELAARRRIEAADLAELAARKHKAASEVDPELTKEFAGDVQAQLAREGITELPEYQHAGPGRQHGAPVYGSTGTKLTQFPGKSKMRRGTAEEHGLVEEGLRPMIRESIARPVSRRESYKAARDVIEANRFEPGGKVEWNARDADELFRGPDPVLSPDQWMKVPRQFYKRINDVLDGKGKGKGINAQDFEMVGQLEALRDGKGAPGSHYQIVRKAAMDELVSQLANTLVAPKLAKANRATSFLILGTSPAWAAMQVIAEYGQASVAQPKLLNPRFARKAIAAYKEMSPEKRQAFDSWVGVTTRTIEKAEDLKLDLKAGDMDAAANAYKTLEGTPYGRFLRGIPTSIQRLDAWKGGRIRALTALAKIDKDLNSRANVFLRGVGGMHREMGKALGEMKGKSLREQAEWVAEHPKWARRYQSYLDDVMGNWSALTKNERVAAQAMIFYPFLRMSLRWTFYAFPKRHPIKAAMLYGLGQQNAQQVKRLLHGDPSYFTQWAMVPVDLGGKKAFVDLSRIAPGSNALVEALGGSTEGPKGIAAAKIAQPVLGSLGTAIYGVSPLSGKQEPGSGWNALAQLLSLSPLSRVASEAAVPAGRKKAEGLGQVPIIGSFSTERQEALDKLSAKLRGYGTPERYVRSLVAPPYPKDAGKERDSALLGRVLEAFAKNSSSARDDLSSAYATKMTAATEEGKHRQVGRMRKQRDKQLATMEATYDEANKVLDNLFERYGIEHNREDELFLKYYGEGKYGTGDSSNPWSSSFGGGSNPWSTSDNSGGGESSNPWSSK